MGALCYSDRVYGNITRKWFYLPVGGGGDAAAAFLTDTQASSETVVKRWYPKGPVEVHKIGIMNLATVSVGATADVIPVRFSQNNKASLIGSFKMDLAGATRSPYTISSLMTMNKATLAAGDYVKVWIGTFRTSDGTAAGDASIEGSWAFFMDYRPRYSADEPSKHNY